MRTVTWVPSSDHAPSPGRPMTRTRGAQPTDPTNASLFTTKTLLTDRFRHRDTPFAGRDPQLGRLLSPQGVHRIHPRGTCRRDQASQQADDRGDHDHCHCQQRGNRDDVARREGLLLQLLVHNGIGDE